MNPCPMCRPLVLMVLAGFLGLATAEETKLRVLVLSGANNHHWRETTPATKEDAQRMALP